MKILKVIIILVSGTLAAIANYAMAAENWTPNAYEKTIVVGLSDDSRPFSYASSAKSGEPVLTGYGGYMVEICRRVLATMVTDVNSPFAGYQVIPQVVKATERFEDLRSARIDMLCGPNSITLERLSSFNVSLPLFLSGISYVSVIDDLLPRSRDDCKAIVGLLANTTAINDGLRHIAERDLLQLYDSVVEQFLALPVTSGSGLSELDSVRGLGEKIEAYIDGKRRPERSIGRNAIANQSSIKVPTCSVGYNSAPGPVVVYDSHRQGIEDLCAGRVLFYVGDIDIIRWRLEGNDRCKGKYVLHHETLTREAYAVFFLRPDKARKRTRPQQTLLFAEFNNVLMQKMQRIEGILNYEFSMEFRDIKPSDELSQFFSAYQFIKDQ